jgi:hypothetical protein
MELWAFKRGALRRTPLPDALRIVLGPPRFAIDILAPTAHADFALSQAIATFARVGTGIASDASKKGHAA